MNYGGQVSSQRVTSRGRTETEPVVGGASVGTVTPRGWPQNTAQLSTMTTRPGTTGARGSVGSIPSPLSSPVSSTVARTSVSSTVARTSPNANASIEAKFRSIVEEKIRQLTETLENSIERRSAETDRRLEEAESRLQHQIEGGKAAKPRTTTGWYNDGQGLADDEEFDGRHRIDTQAHPIGKRMSLQSAYDDENESAAELVEGLRQEMDQKLERLERIGDQKIQAALEEFAGSVVAETDGRLAAHNSQVLERIQQELASHQQDVHQHVGTHTENALEEIVAALKKQQEADIMNMQSHVANEHRRMRDIHTQQQQGLAQPSTAPHASIDSSALVKLQQQVNDLQQQFARTAQPKRQRLEPEPLTYDDPGPPTTTLPRAGAPRFSVGTLRDIMVVPGLEKNQSMQRKRVELVREAMGSFRPTPAAGACIPRRKSVVEEYATQGLPAFTDPVVLKLRVELIKTAMGNRPQRRQTFAALPNQQVSLNDLSELAVKSRSQRAMRASVHVAMRA